MTRVTVDTCDNRPGATVEFAALDLRERDRIALVKMITKFLSDKLGGPPVCAVCGEDGVDRLEGRYLCHFHIFMAN